MNTRAAICATAIRRSRPPPSAPRPRRPSLGPFGRLVTAARLVELLLLVAATRSSLSAAARRYRFGSSGETARKAVAARTGSPDDMTRGLIDALVAFVPRRLRRLRWDVAIDCHSCPFTGDPRSSYRQPNRAEGRTTEKDEGDRLLLVGLALLLRQVWVALTGRLAAARGRGEGAKVLEILLDALADALKIGRRRPLAIDLEPPANAA